MLIRDYQPADYPLIESLWKATGIYNEMRGDSPGAIERCNALGGRLLVLSDPVTGHIAGTSWLTYDGRRLHLHHFAVDPGFQNRGLGRRLALESLRFAGQKGCPVKLEVHNRNRAAINLYESLGFKILEDYGVYINPDPAAAPDTGKSPPGV